MMLSPCSTMHFLHVAHRSYWTEGYLSGGTHIICSGNEGVTFHVSFQNQYTHSHTNSMLCPLDKRWVKERGGVQSSFSRAVLPSFLIMKTSGTSLDQIMWSAAKFIFVGLILICWLLDRLHSIVHQSIINFMPPASIVYASLGHCVPNPHCPSPWDNLMDEGWQSLIMLSGTDYGPTCFLLAHIRVTLLMIYNSTQRVTQWGVTQCLFTRHAIRRTWSDGGSSITAIICSQFVISC